MTDPIADMLTRIRNASLIKKGVVAMPYSKLKNQLARVLKEAGYIEGVEEKGEGVERSLRLTLRYGKERNPAIRAIRRVSKPGCRVYIDHEHLPVVLNNTGIAIISTSQGLMTNRQAKKAGVGG